MVAEAWFRQFAPDYRFQIEDARELGRPGVPDGEPTGGAAGRAAHRSRR